MTQSYSLPPNWATGLPQIDDEHHQLFKLLMLCRENLQEGGVGFELLFFDFLNHLQAHFSHEEKFMQEIDYPGAFQHATRHRKLADQMMTITLDPENRLAAINHAIEVLFEDIVADDLYLAEFINGRKKNTV